MTNEDDVLKNFGLFLEKEANEKIKKAMQLFIKCDDMYKGIVLHSTGFTGELTAKNLREHFDVVDLLDGLDSLIEDMEDDIKHS